MHFNLSIWLALLLSFAVAVPQDADHPDVSELVDVENRAPFGVVVKPVTNAPTLRPPPSTSDQCYCVPYHTCSDNQRSTDLSSNNKTEILYSDSPCEHYLDVCCGRGASQPSQPSGTVSPTRTPVTQPIAPVTQPTAPVTQPTAPVTQPTAPVTQPTAPAQLPGCGVRNENGIDFNLQGGEPGFSGFAEWPWVVAILDQQTTTSVCGGSIIHPNVILTGSHCVAPGQEGTLVIRAGEWDTQTTKERLPYQERRISQIIQHPEFNDRSLYHDVALVVLSSPLTFDVHINKICLPPANYVTSSRDCYAAGWGKTEFGQAGRYSNILKKVQLPMVASNSCQEQLRKTRLGRRFKLHPSFVCAGGIAGKDTCEGDGGAPLVCPSDRDPRVYVQTGIVAWGIGCNSNVPAVYGNVGYLRPWIEQTMYQLGYAID